MGNHPLNLGLRFILEMTALFAIGWWGWTMHEGWTKYLLAFGLPILTALAWSIFAVPDDPSRSGKTVIITPGWIRLLLELAIFGVGVLTLYMSGLSIISFIFLGFVFLHYLMSYDRLRWLVRQ